MRSTINDQIATYPKRVLRAVVLVLAEIAFVGRAVRVQVMGDVGMPGFDLLGRGNIGGFTGLCIGLLAQLVDVEVVVGICG